MNALTPKEVGVIQIALQGMVENLEEVSQTPAYNFNPEARKDMRDILANAKSALAKIILASGHTVRMDPYVEGDEKEFLTKES